MRRAGGMLVDAGLAGWALAHAGREERASRTVVLQDLIDAAMGLDVDAVEIPVDVAQEAVALWDEAAAVLVGGGVITGTPAQLARQVTKLRTIATQLRSLLAAAGVPDDIATGPHEDPPAPSA